MRLNLYSIVARRRVISALVAVAFFSQPLAVTAQTRAGQNRPARPQQKQRAPRALAVLQWKPDSQGRAVARLLPVAIFDQGKFHDATIYRATPRPMALDPGVVYEAHLRGEPIGFFTIETANQQKEHWAAVGAWKSTAPRFDPGSPRSQSAHVRGSETSAAGGDDAQDDRDQQKRSTTVFDEQGREVPAGQAGAPGSNAPSKKGKYPDPIDRRPRVAKPGEGLPPSSRTGGAQTATTSDPDSDPDRPKLKKNPNGPEQTKSDTPDTSPDPQPSGSTSQNTGSTDAADDSGRPKLHRRGSSSDSTPSPAQSQSKADDTDPDRPVLKRGGTQTHGGRSQESSASAVPMRVKEGGGRRLGDTEDKSYDVIGISDAEQSVDSHSFSLRMSADERENNLQRITALARKEVEAFRTARYGAARSQNARAISPRRGARPRVPVRMPASRWSFSDERLAAFDLFTNNTPQLIYSATVEPEALASKSPETFVTLVVTIDFDGNLQKLYSSVTDSTRLDATPRLELVDAVDSEGGGRGDLLFRRNFGTESDFVLFRVAGSSLEELFHGAWAGE